MAAHSDVSVKICGLTRVDQALAAAEAGARYIGLVFFEKSPRHVSLDLAQDIAMALPTGVAKTALTVNASDALLDEITGKVPLDLLQLHGGESPARVAEVKARYGLPVMKAIGIADASDLPKIAEYETVADLLLVDAKPPKTTDLPGGNGLNFDWRLLQGRDWVCPWMLAGGLTAANLRDAITLTGARIVDVSSGVEAAPGDKDPQKMADFVKAAQDAD
ncbi:MAG: phosphoribosylanthranilate isomerase [Mangrovicoccus sp.]